MSKIIEIPIKEEYSVTNANMAGTVHEFFIIEHLVIRKPLLKLGEQYLLVTIKQIGKFLIANISGLMTYSSTEHACC